MFEINVIAPEFKGLNTIKQHRLINDVRRIIEQTLIYHWFLFFLNRNYFYRHLKKKSKICME